MRLRFSQKGLPAGAMLCFVIFIAAPGIARAPFGLINLVTTDPQIYFEEHLYRRI